MAKWDWLQVKADYLKGGISLRALGKKYGIHPTHVLDVAAKQKWTEQREQVLSKADQKLVEKLPETMAQVKARHAGMGRALQGAAMRAIRDGVKPKNFHEVNMAVRIGADIERDALGLNDKNIQDEVYTKFSQFLFIFNLNGPELQRFVESAIPGGQTPNRNVGTTSPQLPSEATAGA